MALLALSPVPSLKQDTTFQNTVPVQESIHMELSLLENLYLNKDWSEIMIKAASVGDFQLGQWAEQERNKKIETLSLSESKIPFHDLFFLSKIITAEAGSFWLSDEWKLAIGEVLLNRVASSEFPNTITECIYAPNQYYLEDDEFFIELLPHETDVELAFRLLEGERYLIPSAVFQANYPQGSSTYKIFYDEHYEPTYICLSNNLIFYQQEGK